jgi:hypothetical protein
MQGIGRRSIPPHVAAGRVNRMMKRTPLLLFMGGLFLYPASLCAQDSPAPKPQESPAPTAAADGTKALVKATQNPVASLISVPLQNNSNFSVGPYDRTQNVLNIQPVIPARISENWMLITRVIQPIVWQPYASQNAGGQSGIGDMLPTFFVSPAKPAN